MGQQNPDASTIKAMQADLASQAATLALERARLRDLETNLRRWAAELAEKATEIQRIQEVCAGQAVGDIDELRSAIESVLAATKCDLGDNTTCST